VRATKDGNWTASGHGKLVTRGGVDVGYKHTMVFYEKKKNKANKSEGKTDWAMHEYTSITGPEDKQVRNHPSCICGDSLQENIAQINDSLLRYLVCLL
jgi:hypothetical protein